MDSVGGMLDDLKSRLGFSRKDDYADDEYDEYDEYDDYDEYEDEGADEDDRRSTRASSSRTSRFGRPDSSPHLVSFDDVKASTTVPDRLRRDPLDSSSMNMDQTRVGGHYVIDTTVPAPDSPAYRVAQRDAESKIGYTPVYESNLAPIDPIAGKTAGAASFSAQTTSAFDPYEAYSTSIPSAHTPTRTLTVVKPTSYGDVERVARAVKSGDVVVLAMRSTPDDLSKRILDFSFGVASALDANVECPGNKVFAIARGSELTEDEKRRLRAQAIL